ncbi:hypothetical protein SGCOL_000608 [Colletotrichum sp. CLE4]
MPDSTPLVQQEGQEKQLSAPALDTDPIESTESKRLVEMRKFLRSLAESHDILHLVNEEPAPTTCEALFKNFASKVSEECSTSHKKLQAENSKFETSSQAHAQLEGEKTALQEIVAKQADKLGEFGLLEKKAQELGDQVKSCMAERYRFKSDLQANQEKLKMTENELNEKEIALQHLTAEHNEVQMRSQQMAPPMNEEELKNNIYELRDKLEDEITAKAAAERKLEEETGRWQAKEMRYEDHIYYMENQVVAYQKQVKEAEALTENYQKQLVEQTRKAFQAQIEAENMAFTVDHKIVPLAKFRKLVDNARGEISDL